MMGIIFAALLLAAGFMIVMWFLDKHFDKKSTEEFLVKRPKTKKEEVEEQINNYVKYYTGLEISKSDSHIEAIDKILLCLENMEDEINKK